MKKYWSGRSPGTMNSTVPAPTYPQARAAATAPPTMSARVASSSRRDGASSTIFWCRRWRLHSRSPRLHHAAVGVGEHLHLDVAGMGHEPLDEQGGVPEGAERLPAGRRDGRGEVGRVGDHAHALAAAAGRWLEHHRQADVEGGRGQLLVREPGFVASRAPPGPRPRRPCAWR